MLWENLCLNYFRQCRILTVLKFYLNLNGIKVSNPLLTGAILKIIYYSLLCFEIKTGVPQTHFYTAIHAKKIKYKNMIKILIQNK